MRAEMRRVDRAMSEEATWRLLEQAFSGRVGTSDAEGWPYVVPQLFILHERVLYFHNTAAKSHMRANIEANSRICFEVDEPGFIFPYGDKAPCETSVSFESVIAFGQCRTVDGREAKIRFFERFMAKYADPEWQRPQVWPLLDATTVYEMQIERITGKRRPVTVADKWRHLFAETPSAGERRRR